MKTVKIFKITCTKAYQMGEQGSGFSLYGWGSNTDYYEGYDDGGKDYILPNGFHLSTSVEGQHEIYGPDGDPCDLCVHSCGRPQIVTRSSTPVLRLAEITEITV